MGKGLSIFPPTSENDATCLMKIQAKLMLIPSQDLQTLWFCVIGNEIRSEIFPIVNRMVFLNIKSLYFCFNLLVSIMAACPLCKHVPVQNINYFVHQQCGMIPGERHFCVPQRARKFDVLNPYHISSNIQKVGGFNEIPYGCTLQCTYFFDKAFQKYFPKLLC